MPSVSERPEAPTAIQTHLSASFVSLELSRSIWLITSLSPASGEKMSKHSVRAGDVAALLARFSELEPQSALTLWFKERVSGNGGHFQEVDHRRAGAEAAGGVVEAHVTAGVVIDGAVMKDA